MPRFWQIGILENLYVENIPHQMFLESKLKINLMELLYLYDLCYNRGLANRWRKVHDHWLSTQFSDLISTFKSAPNDADAFMNIINALLKQSEDDKSVREEAVYWCLCLFYHNLQHEALLAGFLLDQSFNSIPQSIVKRIISRRDVSDQFICDILQRIMVMKKLGFQSNAKVGELLVSHDDQMEKGEVIKLTLGLWRQNVWVQLAQIDQKFLKFPPASCIHLAATKFWEFLDAESKKYLGLIPAELLAAQGKISNLAPIHTKAGVDVTINGWVSIVIMAFIYLYRYGYFPINFDQPLLNIFLERHFEPVKEDQKAADHHILELIARVFKSWQAHYYFTSFEFERFQPTYRTMAFHEMS